MELLLGAGSRAEAFLDDSLGRALDKLARAQPAKVFSTLCLLAYTHEHIPLDTGHWDSASRSVAGVFAEAADAPYGPPMAIRRIFAPT